MRGEEEEVEEEVEEGEEEEPEVVLQELGLLGAEHGISGPARVQRLVFVADQAERLDRAAAAAAVERARGADDGGEAGRNGRGRRRGRSRLASAALRRAVDELKAGENTALYASVVERLGKMEAARTTSEDVTMSSSGDEAKPREGQEEDGRTEEEVAVDHAWMEATDRRSQQKLERLEIQVKHFKSNLVKESVRIGHDDLGDFFYARGDLPTALKHYVQTRDYCSTSKHLVSSCLKVIRVAVAMGNYDNVRSFIDKTEHVNEPPGEPALNTLRIASGLASLHDGGNLGYKLTAKRFIEVMSSRAWSGGGGGGGGSGADATTGAAGPVARTGSAAAPNIPVAGTSGIGVGVSARGAGSAGNDTGMAHAVAGISGGRGAASDGVLRGGIGRDASASHRPQPGDAIALPDEQGQGLMGTLAAETGAALLSVRDVATLGSLCALATFERSELRQRVRENADFRACLERVPRVRDLVNEFYENRYASCLQHLARLRELLVYDFYLHNHIDVLIMNIRQRALVNYTKPFSTLRLMNMATSFNTSLTGIEKECKELILKGMINARIDSHNKILYARRMDERSSTFAKALARGDEYIQETHSLILRAKMVLNDMAQKQRTGDDDVTRDFLTMVEAEEENDE